jgi:hypothetical protein
MSPISEEYRLVISLKPKLLAIQDLAKQTVLAYSSRPSLFALRTFLIQINKDLIDFRDTFTIILHRLYGNTNERIATYIVEMNIYAFNILSQRDKFTWIDREPIQPSDVNTIITSLNNLSLRIDTNALTCIDNLARSIERRDNPRAFNLSRSSSRSSSSSSTSRSSSSSSSSNRSRRSSPSTPPPPPRQAVTPLNLGALSTPNNRRPPPPLERQNARIDLLETPLPLFRLSSTSSLDLSDARGKKYRKTKVKRRINMKATHRKPLATNNSRKHRKTKTSTKKNN